MADSHTLLAFALTSWVFVLVPGPSVLFVISRGVTLGRKAAVLTVFGNAAGILVQLVLVAAGIGAVLERSQTAYNVLRLAGAAYIVWLGVQAIRHRRELSTVLDATAVRSSRRIVREGFVVGLTNPKGFVFYTAVLPQFVDPNGFSPTVQLGVLGAICITIAVLSDSMYGVLAGTARAWLAGRPHRLERLGGAGGLVMIG
ncbi:MAG TPA: LysE family translocator, partial [Acidimicrobiales bacterium]|nr:LysE family translocator [Acidimicrobiales bacterium]